MTKRRSTHPLARSYWTNIHCPWHSPSEVMPSPFGGINSTTGESLVASSRMLSTSFALTCTTFSSVPLLGHNSVSKRLSVSITVGFDPPRRVGTQAAFADCPGGGTNASAIADLLSPTQAPLRRGAFSCHNAGEICGCGTLSGPVDSSSNSALSPVSKRGFSYGAGDAPAAILILDNATPHLGMPSMTRKE